MRSPKLINPVKIHQRHLRRSKGAVNYLTHGYRHLDRPWFLAGTALPDWLRTLGLRVSETALATPAPPHAEDDPGRTADELQELRSGIQQHLFDDSWFHRSAVFESVTTEATLGLRELHSDPLFRARFVGHLLTELLLDAELERQRPGLVDAYYGALETVDLGRLAAATESILGRPAPGLELRAARFLELQFLRDYATDRELLLRVNQVMSRVGLPRVPERVRDLLPDLRVLVRRKLPELLTEPPRG